MGQAEPYVALLAATGTNGPVSPNGSYAQEGLHNGAACYVRIGGGFWLWKTATAEWRISVALDEATNYWTLATGGPTGTYTAHGAVMTGSVAVATI